jgi:hypothetical protein
LPSKARPKIRQIEAPFENENASVKDLNGGQKHGTLRLENERDGHIIVRERAETLSQNADGHERILSRGTKKWTQIHVSYTYH